MLTTKIRRRITTIGATIALVAIPIAALAGNVFNDVADDHTHIEGITWVKDSGVSVGCDNNGNYCPDDNVTRAQMGTFMYRLSGNDPATAPSVAAASAENADKLDGRHANELTRVAYDQESYSTLDGANGTFGVGLSATMEAPGKGFLIISASANIESGVTDTVVCGIEVNQAQVVPSTRIIEVGANWRGICATDAVYKAYGAGTFVVDLFFSNLDPTTTVNASALTVLYVPFDGQGGQPSFIIGALEATDNG